MRALINLLLVFFIPFALCPLLLRISLYFDKKFRQIIWNKKIKNQAKRNKRSK